MKKIMMLVLSVVALTIILSGCGSGGGGNNGNPPPAEVQSVLTDFTNNISNSDEAIQSFSIPFDFTDFNGKQTTIDSINAGKNIIDGLEITGITILKSQYKSTGADTGEVTMTARATGDPGESSDYVFILNMLKVSEVWKIASLAPKSVSGTLIPDEIDDVLEKVGYIIDPNYSGDKQTMVTDCFDLPITANGKTISTVDLVLDALSELSDDGEIDTKDKTCKLTIGDKGTFSFTISGDGDTRFQTNMVFVAGKWKFKNLTFKEIN
jgi:hypothetical protein